MVERLNMQEWDVDPVKVYKHMTEKELDIDEHSRLVSSRRNSAQ
jgi:protein associated with RNAse G/E